MQKRNSATIVDPQFYLSVWLLID